MQFFIGKTLFKKSILGGIFFLLVIIPLSLYLFGFEPKGRAELNQKPDYTVELREEGFYPQELTIQKGQTVGFITKKNKEFWPASNIHPSHTIYSEFDSGEPVEPQESWSFQFDKVGTWKYHKHLASYYTGTIIVFDEKGTAITYNCNEEDNSSDWSKRQCKEDTILRVLTEQGVGTAFDVLEDFYTTDPDFAADCHGYTHLIGEEAYALYAEGKEIVLGASTSFCGYGFYHGFMETLVFTKGDIKEAREFCAYVDNQLSKQSAGASNACYHGIGHGTVDGSDPRAWGDAQSVIQPGLEMCELIGANEFQKYLCGSGVFNSLAIMYVGGQYKLSFDRQDPYATCRTQEEPYFQKSCYEEMNTLVLSVADFEFQEAVLLVESISDDYYAQRAMEGLASYAASFRSARPTENTDLVLTCRSLSDRLHMICITGFVGGLLEFGPPGYQYVPALEFCGLNIFTEEEQHACYKTALGHTSHLFPEEKYQEVCTLVEQQYKKLCP